MDLRAWRKEKGYSLKVAAPMLGLAYGTLSRKETGARPTFTRKQVDIIFKITNGNVTACDLYGQNDLLNNTNASSKVDEK